MRITKDQLNFLESQKISLNKVFDATGLSKTEYHPIMKEMDKIIAIGVTPCAKFSHAMRSRNGHCVQCNTATIAFLERHYEKGYIYIAGSKKEKVVKVGFASDISHREQSLNDERYGEIDDWKILFQVMCKNAGKIEFNTHKTLNKYFTDRNYIKNNKRNECYEIFSCSYFLAKETLDKSIGDKRKIKKSKENINIINQYDFDNVVTNKKRTVISRITTERAKPLITKSYAIKNKKKILQIAKDYGKQKTLKDRIKFVFDNPLSEEPERKEKLNFFGYMWRTKIGGFLMLASVFLIAWFSTMYFGLLGWLLAVPSYLYFLIKSMDWIEWE